MTIRPADIVAMANRALLWSTALVVGAALTASPVSAKEKQASGPVACSQLAADPALGLVGNKVIKSVDSTIIQATGPNRAYCQVNVLYGESPEQNINIRVGLPLNSLDGGTGGVQGAWNGRTQGIGGGGCSGSLGVTGPVNAGYVGSGTDTGHTGGNCEPGVNAGRHLQPPVHQGLHPQRHQAADAAVEGDRAAPTTGMKPAYNYWNGCSTGGRQGYLLAQELGKELDGILANAPAIYWTRFQTAQMWGQIVMNEVVGGPIAAAKLSQATASAVAACDAADGVIDGVIDDPRTCTFSATANICGAPTAPAANCLTPAEAEVIDRIWDGPRNAKGQRIWFGLDRGTNLGGVERHEPVRPRRHAVPLERARPDLRLARRSTTDELSRRWRRTARATSRTSPIRSAISTSSGASGGKLLTFVGANDQLIMPRGVIHYYRQMASALRQGQRAGLRARCRSFYRLFRAPGVGHCGGGNGPQPQNLFGALVNWVENDVAPAQILAQHDERRRGTRTRPLCPYPQRRSTTAPAAPTTRANFHCGGDLETPEVVCADVLTKYKHEVKGPLSFKDSVKDHHVASAAPTRTSLMSSPPAACAPPSDASSRGSIPIAAGLSRRLERTPDSFTTLESALEAAESRGLRPGEPSGVLGVMYPGALSSARFGVVLGRFCSRRISRRLLRGSPGPRMRAAVRVARRTGHPGTTGTGFIQRRGGDDHGSPDDASDVAHHRFPGRRRRGDGALGSARPRTGSAAQGRRWSCRTPASTRCSASRSPRAWSWSSPGRTGRWRAARSR